MSIDTLVDVSRAKVTTINDNNQTLCKPMTALLYSLGLTDPQFTMDEAESIPIAPVTIEQLDGLTLKQLGSLLKFLGAALSAIGDKVDGRKIEAELLEGGYASIDAAIADVHERFKDNKNDETRIARNFEMVRDVIQVLDAQVSPAFILELLNRVVIVRNSVVYAASQVRER